MFFYKKKIYQKRESNVLAGRTKRSFNADATLQKDKRRVGMLLLDEVAA
jgi:hypothetical protein